MTTQSPPTEQRAVTAALLGLAVQALLGVVLMLLAMWSQVPALGVTTFHLFGGLSVWLVLALLYHLQRQERIESLEARQLSADQSTALFDDRIHSLSIARRRLDRLMGLGLSITSLATGLYLLVSGVLLAYVHQARLASGKSLIGTLGTRVDPLALMFMLGGAAFLAFLVGRYVAGMTRHRQWQLLRGGAGSLMGSCVALTLLTAATLFGRITENYQPLAYLAVILPALMALIGLETLTSLVLGVYRPRRPGELPRPAFDSRLLGLLSSPESISKIVSETLNYQFGLELSKSWFYQLLGRWAAWLVVGGVLLLFGISSFVVIAPDQQGVVTRFGALHRIAEPGLSLKAPWPIDRVEKYEVGRIHRLFVGSARTKEDPSIAILWTNQHTEGKEEYLIALPTRQLGDAESGQAGDDTAASVSLVVAEVTVQYRIADLSRYILVARHAEQVLSAEADAVLNAYASTHEIDALLASGRALAERELREQLQPIAQRLGLEVVFAGITGIHPPQANDVAAAFHEQIGALQERESAIEQAQTQAIASLSAVAGSPEAALELDEAIRRFEALRTAGEKTDEIEAHIEGLLAKVNGRAATVVFEARAYQWRRAVAERAQAERFASEVKAFEQSPRYYQTRQYLDTLAQGLAQPRKIVIITDNPDETVMRFDLKDAANALEFTLE